MFVYVSLIEMHTVAGNMMKILTNFPYSHITFSFDEDLNSCHAIQAMNEHTPLVANYVNENSSYYVIDNKRNRKIRIVKYKIPVTEEEKNKFLNFYNQNNFDYSFEEFIELHMFPIDALEIYTEDNERIAFIDFIPDGDVYLIWIDVYEKEYQEKLIDLIQQII